MTALGLSFEYSVGSNSGPDVLEHLALGFERLGVEVSKWGAYLFPHLMPVFEQAITAQFDAQGAGPVGGHWASLTEAYSKWKAKHYPGAPILVASKKLMAALTVSGADGALREVTPTTMTYGTRGVEYASYHQLGTTRMAARPEVDFGPAVTGAIREAAMTAVRELLAVSRLEALLDGPIGPLTEEAAMLGPLTKAQASAAKGRATRIKKLQTLKTKREGR